MSEPVARAICVTPDLSRRQALRRALFAAGRQVEFVDAIGDLAEERANGCLVVVDASTNADDVRARLAEVRERFQGAQIVALGEHLGQEGALDILRHCDHLLGKTQSRHGVDEDEVFVTSVKLSRADIFGLEKYLAWGAVVREHAVYSYDDKRATVNAVAEYAAEAGARRTTIQRIEAVADELLMNALYDAPAQRGGSREALQERARPGGGPVTDQPVVVRFACDGSHFAVSVHDSFGELRKSAIVEHLERARAHHGAPRQDQAAGAGLGLYFVLNAVTRLIANIVPGQATEVIALFDLRNSGREQPVSARSLSIFTA